MNAVSLIEAGFRRDAIEEEGIKQRIVAISEIRIDGVERVGVFGPEIARRQHAGEQNRQVAVVHQARQQLVESIAGDRRIDGAQCIVGAELDNHCIGVAVDRPIDAGETVAGGIAGDTAVDHDNVMTTSLKRLFELGRKRITLIDAETSRQTVAERDDLERIG